MYRFLPGVHEVIDYLNTLTPVYRMIVASKAIDYIRGGEYSLFTEEEIAEIDKMDALLIAYLEGAEQVLFELHIGSL